jgi:hypothetical protein
MGIVVQLPARNGFSEQERQRITIVAAGAGASVAWYRSECGAVWGCLESANDTIGTITREKGMVQWFPRDSLSPFLSHISLDECLNRVRRVL